MEPANIQKAVRALVDLQLQYEEEEISDTSYTQGVKAILDRFDFADHETLKKLAIEQYEKEEVDDE